MVPGFTIELEENHNGKENRLLRCDINAHWCCIWMGVGIANGNAAIGARVGALVGGFLGWFIAAVAFEQNKRKNKGRSIMDKTTKTILIVLGSVLVLCACAGVAVFATGLWSFSQLVNFAERSVSESPQVAVRLGSEIADFEVPKGFGSPYSIHFGDVTLIGYKSRSEKSHLLLAQFPQGTSINLDEMLRIIEEGSGDPNSIWHKTETTIVEQKPVTICGQETTLNISEGISSDGVEFRMATAKFKGRGGPSLVMIAGPLEEWDADMVETFIESIQ